MSPSSCELIPVVLEPGSKESPEIASNRRLIQLLFSKILNAASSKFLRAARTPINECLQWRSELVTKNLIKKHKIL